MHSRSGYGPVPGNPIIPVELHLQYTFDLFDDNKAKDLKVKPIEAEFARLEETMRSVVQETNSLGKVQQFMRNTNGNFGCCHFVFNQQLTLLCLENTFNLLKYLSAASVLVFIGVNVYQIHYMKRYFKSKKLI